MFDVIAIGSATIDIFAYTDKNRFLCIKGKKGKQCFISYPAGDKILLNTIDYTTGGGGTNTAVSFSRLGFRTAYLGNIGQDNEGDKIIAELKKENVSFIGTRGKQKTNTSIVLDSIGHDRTLLVYKEASDYLEFSRISKNNFSAKWFYFSSLIGKSFYAMERLAEFAAMCGIKVAFNPSDYQAKKGKKALKKMLGLTDLLVLNKEEAQLLLKSREENTRILLKKLFFCGKKFIAVGITDGKNGASIYDGKTAYHLNASKNLKVVETTGAGDAFASTFVAGLILGKPIDTCLKMAMINSESVITHHGAKNKLLTRKEILSKLKKEKMVVKKTRI
ncbi:MAG: carbohydrate kinase family protein [Candidatus Woesearchaeota archaeon]